MEDLRYDTEDRIYALATPWAPSALAVIRTTGPGCIEALAPRFSRPEALRSAPGGRALFGRFLGLDGAVLDEVVVTVFRAPASATGQDVAEISAHGSLPGLKRLLEALGASGFRPAGPGEFTLRGFLAGKLDLTQAEAVHEVVTAKTARAQALAVDRLGGGVSQRILEAQDRLLAVLALTNIQLDYAEDDVATLEIPVDVLTEVRADLGRLAATYRSGRLYQEGLRVALAGRTNAGKSSLFNLLLREDRSIVSDEHGTTRDWLEAWIEVEGLPLRIFDTAGLRQTDGAVEREGIRRSRELIDAAEVVLYLVDGSTDLAAEDRAWLEAWAADPRLVVVRTKADLVDPARRVEGLWLSSKTGEGLEAVHRALVDRVPGSRPEAGGGALVDSLRQKDLLDRAGAALDLAIAGARARASYDLVAVDLQDALGALGEIVGTVTTADVLDRMFSSFCVGK